MKPVKILHCADVHLGAAEAFLGSNAQKRRIETLLTFEKILQTAKENKVDLLLIAGDLFDSNRIESDFTERVFEGMKNIPDTKILIVAGNHDPLTGESPFLKYKLPENVYVFGGEDSVKTFEDLNVRIYGRSFTGVYMYGSPRFSLIPQDNYTNILLLHGDTSGDINSDYNGITSEFINNSGMDYIALGHIHARSDIKRIGNTYYAYPGCPEGQGFDELGEKGVYIGSVSKEECRLDFIPVCRRQHISTEIDITSCENIADICTLINSTLQERYSENYNENLYKITLTGNISEDFNLSLEEITARISAQVYFAKIRDNTNIRYDLDSLAKENSLKGIFVQKMLERLQTAEGKEKEITEQALKIGLKAFTSEVIYRDDN